MDLSGAMPRSAWYEITSADGTLLVSVPAQIEGGAISAELPVFASGQRGRIVLCTADRDESVLRSEAAVEELPTQPLLRVDQIG